MSAPPEASIDRTGLLAAAEDLARELAWLGRVIATRRDQTTHGVEPDTDGSLGVLAPPDLSASTSTYGRFLQHYRAGPIERLTVILALAPHLNPGVLEPLSRTDPKLGRCPARVGGVWLGPGAKFWPTVETLLFLVAGEDLALRLAAREVFDPDHFLVHHGVLDLRDSAAVSLEDTPLRIDRDHLGLLTVGEAPNPRFGPGFPAQRLESTLAWDDLVLHPTTHRQIEDIVLWLRHGDTLLDDWGLRGRLRPGLRGLFHGPPGTGKTLTACLLGKRVGRPVYRVDLAQVVSKYIGETSRNLSQVFDRAEGQGWILFFDEADALFGKRTETRDAHDRHANQEVAFLLQRIERFDGVVLLATNLRDNLDDAFSRRFEAMIHFPLPRFEERLELWTRSIPQQVELDASVDLEQLARDHPLSGATILNVIRDVSLRALDAETTVLTHENLLRAIRGELTKEGKAP